MQGIREVLIGLRIRQGGQVYVRVHVVLSQQIIHHQERQDGYLVQGILHQEAQIPVLQDQIIPHHAVLDRVIQLHGVQVQVILHRVVREAVHLEVVPVQVHPVHRAGEGNIVLKD